MQRRFGLPAGLLMGILALGSCKKDPLVNLTNDESRIYVVNYDTTVAFSTYRTFSIVDSVDVIDNNQLSGREHSTFDSTVIAAVTQAMQQRGFQLVARSDSPNLAVDISRVYNTTTGVFSYADYWDYYGSYWDPYYWGYPGYGYYSPYAVGTYTIQSGGLEIDLLDLKNAASHNNQIGSVWTGLVRGEGVFSTTNAASGVAALFNQSPYLKTTN
ncbi:MAG: DUF4136 domain-containing protein [Bacteroidota bacterium]|nr:DUF4136 domain-containing protein [Bacteroidota bacterium]MDP4217497.1 DUF4136 domain-containing protein [Bacteroidota bacterium]MDP4245813.1 DUF4136 domain-containing protein [Bacteroidota bacterium]MDP4252472.1 DUF4136 domain-containing protein [Bacteroidota bacterium]MDP4256656.1 DUF4136 domain-containing protein [Bacteroidota bacterium]